MLDPIGNELLCFIENLFNFNYFNFFNYAYFILP